MARIRIGELALLECTSCDGVWVDAEEFERICADREAQAAVLHRWNNHAPGTPIARVHYRPCVRCGKMMNRVNFSRLSGTISTPASSTPSSRSSKTAASIARASATRATSRKNAAG